MAYSVSLLNTFMDDCQAKAFLYKIVGFSERPNIYSASGDLCHDIAARFHPEKRDGDPEFETLKDGLRAYKEGWGVLIARLQLQDTLRVRLETDRVYERGKTGLENYFEETFNNNNAHPFYIEQRRSVRIVGQKVNFRIDQVRELDHDLIPLWRPDIAGTQLLEFWYTNHIPVDLKFGERSDPFSGRILFGNMVAVPVQHLTSAERRQSLLYTLGYMGIFKGKVPNKPKRYRKPLGFLFYYPYQQTAGFVYATKPDIDLVKSELRFMARVFKERSWKRVLVDSKCLNCSFRTDCRGQHDEFVHVPLWELPSVIRGIPDWQYEAGIIEEGTQTRLPF